MWGWTRPCALFCGERSPLHPRCVPGIPPGAPLCKAESLLQLRCGQDPPSVPCSVGKGTSSTHPVEWDFPLCLVLCGRGSLPALLCTGTSLCALFCRERSLLHPLCGAGPSPCSMGQESHSIPSVGQGHPLLSSSHGGQGPSLSALQSPLGQGPPQGNGAVPISLQTSKGSGLCFWDVWQHYRAAIRSRSWGRGDSPEQGTADTGAMDWDCITPEGWRRGLRWHKGTGACPHPAPVLPGPP